MHSRCFQTAVIYGLGKQIIQKKKKKKKCNLSTFKSNTVQCQIHMQVNDFKNRTVAEQDRWSVFAVKPT